MEGRKEPQNWWQWNHYNLDTLRIDESVLISDMSSFRIWDKKHVPFLQLSLFQDVLVRGVLHPHL